MKRFGRIIFVHARLIRACVITCALVINAFTQIQCSSLLGRAGIMYTTTQNNFRDQQGAYGLVRMTNGFTVAQPASGVQSTHGASVYMDTSMSVSGAIDLRDTNTIILLADLNLDNGVTFSYGGRIYGYDRAVILGGDFTVPTGSVIHIGGRIAIDGRGNKLILGKSSQIFVDAGSTLTLRNLVLQNTQNNPGNPPILCGAGGTAAYCSNLCLDNVELALASNFYFNRGQMFIHNDVAVTGTSALVYRSCQPSFITSGAHLYFDVGTTFSFAPATFTDCPYSVASTTTTNNFIHMADATSTLILNGSSFFTTTTGLRLTTGTVLFDNRVTLQSKASFDLASTNTSPVAFIHSATTSSGATAGSWSPDGRFLAACGTSYLQVFRFSGSGNPTQVGSTITSGLNAVRSAVWSPDGKFIAVVNNGNNTTNVVSIFSFNGSSTPTLVGVANSKLAKAAESYWVTWSPDGRYLAVVYYDSSSTANLEIFNFTGYGNPISTGSTSSGTVASVSWSPDGRFIAVVNRTTSTLQIFSVTAGVPSSSAVGSVPVLGGPFALAWSPDGRFIAIVYNSNPGAMQIFRFYGSSDSTPSQVGSSLTNLGNSTAGVTWSPDGRFLAATNYSSNTLQIYSFNGYSAPTQVGSNITTASEPNWVSWSPNGQFIVVACQGVSRVQVFGVNYIVSQTPQALSNSIVFGNSSLGSSYDANVRGLSGAQMAIDGLINYDCVS